MKDSTETPTIEEFIEDRLQEDEAIARGAWKEGALNGDRWVVARIEDEDGVFGSGIHVFTVDAPPHGDVAVIHDGETGHIANHDPARVLREVAAKRAAVSRYLNDDDVVMWPVIGAIAAIWSDHPDYRPEWIS